MTLGAWDYDCWDKKSHAIFSTMYTVDVMLNWVALGIWNWKKLLCVHAAYMLIYRRLTSGRNLNRVNLAQGATLGEKEKIQI